ncbi:BAR adaptor protein Hob1 [Ceratocystis pirilliformis]|uniref:BAR adaptor protein Hob1 n=1 Tax=Ceratocystis pirilliformis TaxID=259994 RepID=A0ABR3Z2X2_9PEZI
MSFKGLTKSIQRAPQQFKAKFSIGENTKDPVYTDAERRFAELENETKKLHDESKKYFEAINGMLSHQLEFSKAMTEIYKPISGRMSDPDSLKIEGNPDGIRACEEYESVVRDLQETLKPELEMIETRIIRPANDLLEVIQVIRKTAVKRDHKQLDYDRHRTTLKKLQDKKERTAKDEKNMWKAENDVEQSTQEFNYYNDLLKEELPKLFHLETLFIQPLFQSFYYMQLNVFYTLHERMQQVDIGYFDLTLDIEEAFLLKRGDVQERAEALTIVRFKTTGRPRPPKFAKPALEGRTPGLLTAGPSASSSSPTATPILTSAPPATAKYSLPTSSTSSSIPSSSSSRLPFHKKNDSDSAPPPYSPLKPSTLASSHTTPNLSLTAAAKSKPPPPKPKPSRFSMQPQAAPAVEYVTALFDYAAQAEGDLSFSTGDRIEIVFRSNDTNEWWTGRLNGREGQFPGNYVEIH